MCAQQCVSVNIGECGNVKHGVSVNMCTCVRVCECECVKCVSVEVCMGERSSVRVCERVCECMSSEWGAGRWVLPSPVLSERSVGL